MRTRAASIALASLLATGATAFAQQGADPITWVAYDLVKPGKLQDAVALVRENDAAVMDQLMADGTIQSWGVATPVNHENGFDWNMLTWVTVPDWAAVDRWLAAAVAQMNARSDEEAQALEEKNAAVYVERSHFDGVVRNVVLSPPAPDATRPRYIFSGMSKVEEGQFEAGRKAFDPWWPIVDKLKAEGKVLSYGLQAQALHSDPTFTFRDWYMLPDLAGIDAIDAAAEAEWTAEANAAFEAAFEAEPHRDVILMILHLGGQPAE